MNRKILLLGGATVVLAWSAAAYALDRWGQGKTFSASAPADCIVVLGAKVIPPGVAGPSLRARSERAAALYHAGAARYVICTGGTGDTPPAESLIGANVLLRNYVPPRAIVREESSTTTWENISQAAAICRVRGWKRVIVVSNGYHLWRATRNFRSLGLEAVPATAANPPAGSRAWMSLREVLSVLRDAFTGRL